MDISINESLCDDRFQTVDDSLTLRIATPEDIVAEKLRALLQQQGRGRNRRQDLLDIATLLDAGVSLDPARVSNFLLAKANVRNVVVTRSALAGEPLKTHALEGYDALASTAHRRFIPFDEAYALLIAFVNRLDIPE